MSSAKVVSWEIDFSAWSGVTARASSPWARRQSRSPRLPKRRMQRLAVAGAQVGDGADALGLERAHGGAADAPDDRDRLAGEEVGGLGAADQREAARLVEVGGDLGEELVVGEADRDGEAELALDAGLQAGEQDRRRGAVQALGAGEVEEGLVERERLDQRGELEHHRADLRGETST